MRKAVQGIVVEINNRSCIIMTREGEFYQVPRPTREVMIGEEIRAQLPVSYWSKWLRWGSLAVAILLMFTGWCFYRYTLPVAVAHVSLDINPSLELSVDRNGCVIDGVGFNTEGQYLLAAVPIKGKDIYAVVGEIVVVAIQQNYLTPGKENLVFTTVVEDAAEEASKVVEEDLVYQTIVRTLEASDLPVEVLVTRTKLELHQQAHRTGVSTGRFLLYQDAVLEEPAIKETNWKNKNINELKIQQWSEKHQNEVKANNKFKQKNEPKNNLSNLNNLTKEEKEKAWLEEKENKENKDKDKDSKDDKEKVHREGKDDKGKGNKEGQRLKEDKEDNEEKPQSPKNQGQENKANKIGEKEVKIKVKD